MPALANLLDGLTTVLRISRIPSACPDTPHETAHARPRLLERIVLAGAEPKRSVHDSERPLGVDPRQGVRHIDECPHFQIDQITGGRPRGERFIRLYGARVEGDQIHRGQLFQDGELVRSPFGVRQPARQLERVLELRGGFARRVPPPGGLGRDPQVLYGACVVASVLEVIGEERRPFAQVFREAGLRPFGGLPVELYSAARCDSAVQHLTIQRVSELIKWRDRPVRKLLERSRTQNVSAAGQSLTHLLEVARIGVHGRRSPRDDRECAILSEARHLEHLLFLRAEPLDLNLDHLPETLGYGELDLVQGAPELPALLSTRDEPPPDEVVQGGDHEQGIPLGVLVDERRQPVRQRGFRLFRDEVVDHLGFVQRPQRNLVTQVPGAKILLERSQWML